MEQDYKLIGAPCAVRGPYTFYKAFKYTKNGVTNILTINEFFFVKLWNDSDFISIGELRLLWEDQSCDKALASLRLYILPENTPDGRVGDLHGEDEVLAITEKVIIRLEDLLTWITDASDWHWGLSSVWTRQTNGTTTAASAAAVKSEELNDVAPDASSTTPALQSEQRSKINGSINEIESHRNDCPVLNKSNTLEDCSAIDYSDVLKEKTQLDFKNWDCRTGVLVLSYSRYCRYRALLRRLEGVHNDWLRDDLIAALGGFATIYRTTKILFCRDTFDYPELEGHELLCNHLAPKLRSRIPKKKKTLYPSPDVSDTDSSEYGTEDDERSSSASSCSSSNNSNNSLAARFASNLEQQTGIKRPDSKKLPNNQVSMAQRAFTQNLYAFMKARLTPIGRLPLVGNKEINLYEFYNKVKLLGSYASVTNNKLWKYVFEELGGDRGDPSMATLMRKYYEKFLLPYEQHMIQQLKHSTANQSTSGGSGGVIKTPCLPPSLNTDYRYQADRRKVVTTIRPVPGSVRIMDSSSKSGPGGVATSPAQHQLMKPPSLQSTTGGKENIPISRKLSSGSNHSGTSHTSAEVVIDLCAEDESSSRATASRKCSSTEPVVIDLCEESPIKRSVPSIAATLLPRKRKLDILREGGLEVTPVGTSGGGGSGPATVRRLPPTSVAISAIKSGETSLEIVDGASQKAKLNRASNQVLDLRTMRNSSDEEDSMVKKFSPSLGPNIEISLVANNDGPAASNGAAKEDKKRKSASLPVPALRKISTGELSVKNLANSDDTSSFKPKVIAGRKMSSDVTLTKAPSKPATASIATSAAPAHIKDKQAVASLIQHVNPVYLAAFYNSMSMFSESGAETFLAAQESANSNNPYQIQLSQQQMNYVKDSFMQQSGPDVDVEAATDAFAQKFTNMLKNGTVSIVENYEKILPD